MLLVLMVSSKGIAGVPRALAGRDRRRAADVQPARGRPAADPGHRPFLDMARTVTNVLGNSIATAVVAKWENAIVPVSDDLASPTRCWTW